MTREPRRAPDVPLPHFAAYAVLAWGLLGAMSFAQQAAARSYRGIPFEVWPALPTILADWWTCGIFTPWFLLMARRFPVRGRAWASVIPAHLGAALLFLACKNALYNPLYNLLHPAQHAPYAGMFVSNIFPDLLAYFGSVGVIHAFLYQQEVQQRALDASKLDADLRNAELENLKTQLHPHFLFNALQAISTLIHRDPAAADRMLTELSDLLRTSLRHTAAQEVPLRDELAVLQRYLEIMRVRFGDRLTISVDVPSDVLDAHVPSLVLQPLAENAIRHGMEARDDRGTVVILGRREGGALVLEVSDDGPGLPASGDRGGNGIGLANTRQRLARLYGPGDALTIHPGIASGRGLTVRLTIPLRQGPS